MNIGQWSRRLPISHRAALLPHSRLNRHDSRVTRYSSTLQKVHRLDSWDLDVFKHAAFIPEKPARLSRHGRHLPPACGKWFIHDGKDEQNLIEKSPHVSELRTAFWTEHVDTMVPLELTTSSSDDENDSSFVRTEAPLKILLAYLGNFASGAMHGKNSIYLAQCDLSVLPPPLRADLPTPELVLSAGKGDVYSSSVWLGRPPTYTPLHRDPNPNLFLQLAGVKAVRLFPPEIGHAIFDMVQEQLRAGGHPVAQSATIRGDEMMQGLERGLLHDAVWHEDPEYGDLTQYGQETQVAMGEALFIPKGWWHSVKGIGQGITASANWWFR